MKKHIALAVLFLLCQLVIRSQEKDSLYLEKVTNLGEITIQGLQHTAIMNNSQAVLLNKNNLTEAVSLLPSVIQAQVGSRNEGFVSVRGFGSRSIPIYLDGIPVYVPFDGEIDLNRLQTYAIDKMTVSKGFSSMEYGANAVGGVLNLVSKKPTKKLQLKAHVAFGSGEKYDYGLMIGGKKKTFYWQGNFYQNQQDNYPLSKQYDTNEHQMSLSRDNSYSKDQKIGFKFGYTPNATDEYTVNYNYQKAEKGNPTYTGEDENIRIRFWQWPKWDKQSIYFLSNTKLKKQTDLKFRLYHDTYKNKLASFDDDTYSSQNFPYAFTSEYNDYSIGGNVVLKTVFSKKQQFTISSHFKQDHHRSNNNEEPTIEFIDNTGTLGLDHTYKLNEKMALISGLSFHNRKSLQAQEYNASNEAIVDLPESNNTAINAQIALKTQLENQQQLSLSVAHKSRFATMKDRYSYRLGSSIPNPDLTSEKANHFELAYKNILTNNMQIEAAIYSSLMQDALQFVNLSNTGITQLQNTGKALFYGFETSIHFFLTEKGKWTTNYSFIVQDNLEHPEINFIDVPKHRIQSYVQYAWTRNFNTSLQAEYYSQRNSTSYGNKAEAFTLLYFNADYCINGFTIYGNIKNILDSDYAFSEGFPNPGRTFSLGIRYELIR